MTSKKTPVQLERVRVVARLRPLLEKEKVRRRIVCCLADPEASTIQLGEERTFAFDGVFNDEGSQEYVYETEISPIVRSFIKGRNCTIFAYGQTGSGKTYTVLGPPELIVRNPPKSLQNSPAQERSIARGSESGEENELEMSKQERSASASLLDAQWQAEMGMLGRALREVMDLCHDDMHFDELNVDQEAEDTDQSDTVGKLKRQKVSLTLHISCLEIYQESLRDLLDPALEEGNLTKGGTGSHVGFGSGTSRHPGSKFQHLGSDGKERNIRLHEMRNGEVTVTGVSQHEIRNYKDAASILERALLARSTSSTGMNEMSSRSHGVFIITMRKIEHMSNGDEIHTSCKLHVMDLAGSERQARTGNVGTRFKESVSINSGLLALGNVINALASDSAADKENQVSGTGRHVPYRDSKLTRLLKGSLGGGCHTLMIACLSPADVDYEENLSTMKYASRALSIKNKVVVRSKVKRHIERSPSSKELVDKVKDAAPSAAYMARKLGLAAAGGEGMDLTDMELSAELQQWLQAEENRPFLREIKVREIRSVNLYRTVQLLERENQQLRSLVEELQGCANETATEAETTAVQKETNDDDQISVNDRSAVTGTPDLDVTHIVHTESTNQSFEEPEQRRKEKTFLMDRLTALSHQNAAVWRSLQALFGLALELFPLLRSSVDMEANPNLHPQVRAMEDFCMSLTYDGHELRTPEDLATENAYADVMTSSPSDKVRPSAELRPTTSPGINDRPTTDTEDRGTPTGGPASMDARRYQLQIFHLQEALREAHEDLQRDEEIFADRQKDFAELRRENERLQRIIAAMTNRPPGAITPGPNRMSPLRDNQRALASQSAPARPLVVMNTLARRMSEQLENNDVVEFDASLNQDTLHRAQTAAPEYGRSAEDPALEVAQEVGDEIEDYMERRRQLGKLAQELQEREKMLKRREQLVSEREALLQKSREVRSQQHDISGAGAAADGTIHSRNRPTTAMDVPRPLGNVSVDSALVCNKHVAGETDDDGDPLEGPPFDASESVNDACLRKKLHRLVSERDLLALQHEGQMDPELQGQLQDIDDEIEALEDHLSFKTKTIDQRSQVLAMTQQQTAPSATQRVAHTTASGSLANADVMLHIDRIDEKQAKLLLKQYVEKVVELREDRQGLEDQLREAELRIEGARRDAETEKRRSAIAQKDLQKQQMAQQVQNGLDVVHKIDSDEQDPQSTRQHRPMTTGAMEVTVQSAEYGPHFQPQLQEMQNRIADLEHQVGHYRSRTRELKSKLREVRASQSGSVALTTR
eukprot:Clim_evm12s159 gene=Clim_evmTU12s159